MNEKFEVVSEGQIKVYDEFRGKLTELRELNSKTVFDYGNKKGNKDARSHISKLRKTKSAIEIARKNEKKESLDYGKRVDKEAKEIMVEIDAMIAVHLKPIKEIEDREEQRISNLQARLDQLSLFLTPDTEMESPILMGELKQVQDIKVDETWEEFELEARKIKEHAIQNYEGAIKRVDEREAAKVELEELKQEKLERDKRDREEILKREATDKARREAEEKAARERVTADRARREIEEKIAKEREAIKENELQLKFEVERKEQELKDKARREKEAAEKRELQLKFDKECAEREKLEAEKHAEEERVKAEKRAKQEIVEAENRAEQEKQRAIENERRLQQERVDRIKQEKKEREENKKHCEKIDNEILFDLGKADISAEESIVFLKALKAGKIRHVKIEY